MPQQTARITQNITIDYYSELYKNFPETTVGNRIEKQRLIKNLSQSDLGSAIGVSSSTIEDYESSKTYPSPTILSKISNALKTPTEYYFDDYYRFAFSDFSSVIKNWRIENNLTLWQAGKLIGVDYRTIENWESGKVISLNYFNKIKKYFES